MYNYNIIQSVVNTKMRKNIFYFYHLTTSPECAILYTLTPKKAVPILSPAEEVIVSILRRWPLLLFQKSFNYISFSSFVNRSFPKKYFLFSLLTRREKSFIMYAVCFYLDCLCHYLRWSRKRPFSLRTTFFYCKSVHYIALRRNVNAQNIRKNILFFLLTTKKNQL